MLRNFSQQMRKLRLFYSHLLQPGLHLRNDEALSLKRRLSVFLQVMAGCPACGGPLVTDLQRGEVVCAQCGLVVSEAAVDTGPEWRSFDKEKRVRTAPLRLVVKTDMAVKAEHGVQWRRLARFHRETLHGRERRLAKIGGEIRRVRECVGLPQHVAEEAELLVKRYFKTVAGFPPEVVAVAVLWTAAKAAGMPRPLEDFLRCSKTSERRVRRVAWRLKEEMRLGRRPSIDDYVKALAARVGLPAPVVKSAVELLERNRRVLAGKNPWVWAAAALWLASLKMLGLLTKLAEASGTTPASIRNAAKKMRV
jgi:transcription initiation factor TFIIB